MLAIDTSTVMAGVALYSGAGLLAELGWPAGRTQTTTLLAEIGRLLALSGLTPRDLGAVAVATGPGSFNSLRVGLSTAKGLAFALDLPLLGVPTLDAVAYPHGGQGYPVRAVIAAGRGRLVSAPYHSSGGVGGGPNDRLNAGRVWRAGDYANTTLEELAASITEATLVCGELPPGHPDVWRELAPLARLVSPALGARCAGCLAELAWRRFRAGERDDSAALEPLYLHGPPGGAQPVPAPPTPPKPAIDL